MRGKPIKIRKSQIPYFISGIIIFTNRFSGTNIYYSIKYIVAGIWALYYLAVVISVQNNVTRKNEKYEQIKSHYNLMIAPFVAFCFYSIAIWAFREDVTIGNYTRLFSTILYLALAWGYASCGYYLFGEKSIDVLFYAGVTSYTLGSIIPLIFNYGVREIGLYLISAITGANTAASYMMEVHDLTFAMGLFFLYYMFVENRKERSHIKKILLSFILIVLGLKRIEILALAVAIVSYWVVLRKGKTMKGRSIFFFLVFSILTVGYVYIIWSGALEILATRFEIDFMGRLGYYSYARKFYKFSPFFLGNGYTYFSRYWGNLYSSGLRIDGYGVAASIHSDILVMFIEIGFIGMLIWIYYCFKYKTVKLNSRNGTAVGEYYLLATIYMFILYLTDNTSTYFITQMIYYLIPLAMGNTSTINVNLKRNGVEMRNER